MDGAEMTRQGSPAKTERNNQVYEMREAGATYRALGKKFNISWERARQIYFKRRWDMGLAQWCKDNIK